MNKINSYFIEEMDVGNDMLNRQIFGQRMLENLVNDLLDLAKLENNAFTLNPEYFNLSQTIYEAFEILLFSANKAKVQLSAEIDNDANISLIQSVMGD